MNIFEDIISSIVLIILTYMSQPIRQTEVPFDTDEDLQSQPIHLLQKNTERHFRVVAFVAMTISALAILYVFSTIGLVKDGYNYR